PARIVLLPRPSIACTPRHWAHIGHLAQEQLVAACNNRCSRAEWQRGSLLRGGGTETARTSVKRLGRNVIAAQRKTPYRGCTQSGDTARVRWIACESGLSSCADPR